MRIGSSARNSRSVPAEIIFEVQFEIPDLILQRQGLLLAAGPANPKRRWRFRETEHLRRGVLGPVTGSGLNDPAWTGATVCVLHSQSRAHCIRIGGRAVECHAEPLPGASIH